MMSESNRERGAALVVSLMLLLAMGFVGAALISMSGADLKVAGFDQRGTQAQFSAEAGIQEVMHRMAVRPGDNVTINGITFDPAIRDANAVPDPNWEVRVYSPGGCDADINGPIVDLHTERQGCQRRHFLPWYGTVGLLQVARRKRR